MKRLGRIPLFYRFPFFEFLYHLKGVRRLYKRLFLSSVPNPQYYVELVNKCNAECIFCTYPLLRDRGKPLTDMTDEFFNKMLTLIESEQRPSISLTPTTGEIFMNTQWDYYLQKVLDLDFVEEVHFYTNGAIFNDKNRARFFRLRNLNKMSISFSTGGADRETYELMFGKDLFCHVKENINEFLRGLKERSLKIPVSIDIKFPKSGTQSRSFCRKIYNECHYQYAFLKIRDTYDTFSGLIENESITRMRSPSLVRRKQPCNYLRDIRFAANGEIWLCGCVISEVPGHQELKVGHLKDATDLGQPRQQLKKMQEEWLHQKKIPFTCRECTWYEASSNIDTPPR
ncbi:MAG: radical SAM protein [Acidobacteriota bacterium]|nr:radical SAM protein [Acidobacteriota bacterium]